jgi:phage tail-like protein
MSRAAVPGLPSRHPIGELLPMLYADDDLAQRFTAGLDTLLAPVFATLDNLPAYFQPRVAPADFVSWLAEWVGMERAVSALGTTEELHRAVVTRAVELHRWRGTRRGLEQRLALSLGAGVEVLDGGGATWSTTPGTAALPAAPGNQLIVRVWPLESAASSRTPVLDEGLLHDIVEESCPVHLTWRVEVLPGPPAREETET